MNESRKQRKIGQFHLRKPPKQISLVIFKKLIILAQVNQKLLKRGKHRHLQKLFLVKHKKSGTLKRNLSRSFQLRLINHLRIRLLRTSQKQAVMQRNLTIRPTTRMTITNNKRTWSRRKVMWSLQISFLKRNDKIIEVFA